MKNTVLYIAIASIFTLSSCKNKLDVLAPGEESVSVYGILNPNENTQNIRINKVFLTDGDATVASQDAAQVNYGAGELEVTLQRFETGTTTPTLTTFGNTTKKLITLTETLVTTQAGAFSTEQRLWKTNDKLFTTGDYKLNIKNLKTGKEWIAQTAMIDSVNLQLTMPLKYSYFPSNPGSSSPNHGQYVYTNQGNGISTVNAFINYFDLTKTIAINFKSIKNARSYKVVIGLNFHEFNSTNDSIEKNIDFDLPIVKSIDLKGDNQLSISFLVNDFYTNLAAKLSTTSNINVIKRKINFIEYKIYSGSEELSDFLLVNAPSTSIAQDKANYTNISGGGIGIFATRSRFSIKKDLWSQFKDVLACNSITKPYLFLNGLGTTCP